MNPVTLACIGLVAVGSWMFFRTSTDSPKFRIGQKVNFVYQRIQGYTSGRIQRVDRIGTNYFYSVECSPDPYMYPGAPVKLNIAINDVDERHLVRDDRQ